MRTHDVGFLLAEAAERDAGLLPFEELCQMTARAYLEERYPGAGRSQMSPARARQIYELGVEFISRLEAGSR